MLLYGILFKIINNLYTYFYYVISVIEYRWNKNFFLWMLILFLLSSYWKCIPQISLHWDNILYSMCRRFRWKSNVILYKNQKYIT